MTRCLCHCFCFSMRRAVLADITETKVLYASTCSLSELDGLSATLISGRGEKKRKIGFRGHRRLLEYV